MIVGNLHRIGKLCNLAGVDGRAVRVVETAAGRCQREAQCSCGRRAGRSSPVLRHRPSPRPPRLPSPPLAPSSSPRRSAPVSPWVSSLHFTLLHFPHRHRCLHLSTLSSHLEAAPFTGFSFEKLRA